MVGASSSWSRALVQISPSTFSVIGIAIGIGVSVLVLSVIFCEVVAIYGVIVAIILQTKLESVPASNIYAPESLRVGYAIFASGIIMGFANLVCGLISSLHPIGGDFFSKIDANPHLASSCKVYGVVPPPHQLLVGVQSSGNELNVKTSSNPCLTSSDGSSTPTPLVSSFDFVNSDLSF
ncbi:V-type proton ATPase subunit c''1 [Vitis vinifera]|uniref:V-type proton ATPase subunit c''1 n=1 Tax=Vitis vinifera TaxID=29760 RepID=A0A438BL59_VITVI|nr:V-type proton ATPase subunit c''1 [Vitis vinifera]